MTPIDERLRAGLVANTDHLMPDLDHELDLMYDHARGRQRMRRGAVALTAAAAVAATAWVVSLPDREGDVVPPVTPNPTPIDMEGLHGPLEPGLYSMAAWGQNKQVDEPLPRAILDVPEGYFSNGGYVIDAGLEGVTDDQLGDISVWHVVQVLADPCQRRTAATVGPSVEDLARALVRQSGPSTRPRPVVLDGHRGLAMEITIPPNTDLTRCTNEDYSLWRTEPQGDGAHGQPHAGVTNHLWILDVNGTRLVVLAALYPDEDPALHQEQLAIAESIHFEPAAP
jgi:hypothetical protein